MTRIGVLARRENRGLGIQTMELQRALDATPLLLDLGIPLDNCGEHPEWHPNAVTVKWRGGILPERPVRNWLETIDVVYTAETIYHPQLATWARRHGVDVVVHINPEFHRDDNAASRWWAPSTWRLDHLPPSTTVIPVPVALDRFDPVEPHREPCRWLHVAGRQALADRNGTDALLAAIPYLTEPCTITIASQTDRAYTYTPNPLVTVRTIGPTANYWDLYRGHDALVMPRRYGGLCLPVQEAMGAGMAVLMSDVSPNHDWPVSHCRTLPGHLEQMPAGRIEVAQIDALHLAQMLDLYADPDLRADRQALSRMWADRHSWEVWGPKYRDLLGAKVAA